VLIGDIGGVQVPSRQVGIFDLQSGQGRTLEMPGTIWHVAVHPTKPIGYAATYSYSLLDYDVSNFAPLYTREYLVEIDLVEARVLRHWSCGAEFPIHLNSDMFVWVDGDGRESLWLCAGGSSTVVEVPLAGFDDAQVMHVKPPIVTRLLSARQGLRNIFEAASRAPLNMRTDEVVQTLEVTGGTVFDGVYATRMSPDGRYFVVGHRGYNWLGVYERTTRKLVYDRTLPQWQGWHLGLHHGAIQPLADGGGTGRLE
jgi:hypothetical protein